MKKALILTAIILMTLATGCPGGSPDPDPDPEPEGNVIRVVNNTDSVLYYLYIAPDPNNTWGEERLAGEMILPGQECVVSDLPDDSYYLITSTASGEYAMYPANGSPHPPVELAGDQTAVWSVDQVGKEPNQGEGIVIYE